MNPGLRARPSQKADHAITRSLVTAIMGAVLLFSGGCGLLPAEVSGDFEMREARPPQRTLPAGFDAGLYSFDAPNRVMVVLVQGAMEQPERAMTIQLFWKPRPGRTPLTRHASNAAVQYIRFEPTADGERAVSVYSGAGFLWPNTRPGRETFGATLREATLRLTDATAEPHQHETPEEAELTGRFEVRRDDVGTSRLLRQIEVAVSGALSYPRFVGVSTDERRREPR